MKRFSRALPAAAAALTVLLVSERPARAAQGGYYGAAGAHMCSCACCRAQRQARDITPFPGHPRVQLNDPCGAASVTVSRTSHRAQQTSAYRLRRPGVYRFRRRVGSRYRRRTVIVYRVRKTK